MSNIFISKERILNTDEHPFLESALGRWALRVIIEKHQHLLDYQEDSKDICIEVIVQDGDK